MKRIPRLKNSLAIPLDGERVCVCVCVCVRERERGRSLYGIGSVRRTMSIHWKRARSPVSSEYVGDKSKIKRRDASILFPFPLSAGPIILSLRNLTQQPVPSRTKRALSAWLMISRVKMPPDLFPRQFRRLGASGLTIQGEKWASGGDDDLKILYFATLLWHFG